MAPGSDPGSYAIGGRVPQRALRPASREELAECLRAASRDGLAVVPWGGGTWLSRAAAPPRYDVAIDLRGLDRLVEYDPEDLTLTAECGMTLAALQQVVRDRGQELPLEGAHAQTATLGGALASNCSGPRRLAMGSPRDRILGARFALADGTLVRTGGRVVKNVAGYGIHRLLCGSRGGLAAFVEASLKLLPAPAARHALVFRVTDAELTDTDRWAFLPGLEPAAVTVLSSRTAARVPALPATSDFLVIVILEDEPPRVAQLADRITVALGRPELVLEAGDVAGLEQALCDAAAPPGPRLEFVTAGNSPAALRVLVGNSAVHDILFNAPAGRLHLVPSSEDPAPIVRRLAGASFLLVATDGFPELPADSLAAITDLRQRIRAALDPSGTWAFGPLWQSPLQNPSITTDV